MTGRIADPGCRLSESYGSDPAHKRPSRSARSDRCPIFADLMER